MRALQRSYRRQRMQHIAHRSYAHNQNLFPFSQRFSCFLFV
jgi:hypothetical protein